MDKSSPNYFPSLYDSNPSSHGNTFDIWKTLPTVPEVLPKAKSETKRASDWPAGLGYISYEPLWIFCPPEENLQPNPSPWDQLCEQEIKRKEKELMVIIEERTERHCQAYKKKVKQFMKSTLKEEEPS